MPKDHKYVKDLSESQLKSVADEIKNKYKLSKFDLRQDPHGSVELSNMEVPAGQRGHKYGTGAVFALTNWADSNNKKLWLNLDVSKRSGVTSRDSLERFYSKHGFVPNSGSKRDYSLPVDAHMYRKTKPVSESISEHIINQVLYTGEIQNSVLTFTNKKKD